jgi:hypothetical protein
MIYVVYNNNEMFFWDIIVYNVKVLNDIIITNLLVAIWFGKVYIVN